MRALARLEGLIRDLVERPASLLASRKLHPLEMAAALTRALEAGALPLADRVLVPDLYVLQLNAEDFQQFAGARATLEREFAEYVARLTVERGLTLNAPPSVAMQAREGVRAGTAEVVARYSNEVAAPAAGTVIAPRRGARSRPPVSPSGGEGGATELLTATAAPRYNGAGAEGAVLELLGEGGAVVRQEPLGEAGVAIGRGSTNGLPIPDPEVSRQHVRIEFVAPRFYLLDLGSTNGTLVNGRRVSGRHPLADGDLITIGRSRLRFRRGG